jgi:hypothetical protein
LICRLLRPELGQRDPAADAGDEHVEPGRDVSPVRRQVPRLAEDQQGDEEAGERAVNAENDDPLVLELREIAS